MSIYRIFPQIACKDGATLSVQASEAHYCSPRDSTGPYSEVEVGFPSVAPPESWMPYCESPDRPTDTVYARVPLALVEEYIAAHGGVDWGVTLTHRGRYFDPKEPRA